MTETRPRAVILGVQLPEVSDEAHRASLRELGRLASTLGLDVVAELSQRRSGLAKAGVVGRGKLAAVARWTGGPGEIPSPAKVKEKKARYVHGKADLEPEPEPPEPELEEDEDEDEDTIRLEVANEELDPNDAGPPVPEDRRASVVLVDHDLTPSQARNLQLATGAEVLDRTTIILAIFARHARTREAKLEVEIARLEYATPRLRESASRGERQRGGIGGRGAGESSAELDRRKVRDRIAELRREIEKIAKTAESRRSRRSEEHMVALVGYTNAGKSSLMRALSGSEVYVADKLFATLDTTVRRLHPEVRPRVLVQDTVGFIKKLPHGLVASFRATLDAANEAHLLLHVVDASDPAFEDHMAVTEASLAEIGADERPSLLLLNKVDRLDPEAIEGLAARFPAAVLLSAHRPEDVAALHGRIVDFFEARMVDAVLEVPYARQALVSTVHERARVTKETYDERGARLELRAMPETLARLHALLAPDLRPGPTRVRDRAR